jgi:hypothetical protein
MAEAQLRFRLFDGTDIGPLSFAVSTPVAVVKETLLREWPAARAPLPRGCSVCARLTPPLRAPQEREVPDGVGALKLILAGRMLDNGLTLAEARTPTDSLCTMHLVISPKARRSAGCG